MQLHTRMHGEGPAIVLLHGLFGSGENLGVIARGLTGDFTVYSMDLRNHGRSPHGEAMDYPTLAGDVIDTLDEHGVENATLLGHSLGGKVAMETAIDRPDRVSHLVALDIAPVQYGRRHDSELEAISALDISGLHSRADADQVLADAIPNEGVRRFLLKNLARGTSGFEWRIPLDTINAQYPELGRPPAAGHFEGPVLFIRGGDSDYVREDHEPAIRKRFPLSRIETIEGAAHWVHIDAPEATIGLVRQFLGAGNHE